MSWTGVDEDTALAQRASPPALDALARRLDEILRALPEGELSALIHRMGVRINAAKRIDTASQVARALVGLPDVRDPSRLPSLSRELLHRVAEAGGLLTVSAVPAGLEPLIARGILFGRRVGGAIELVLPTAFLVQLRSWESEDPRCLRALLAQAPFETVSAMASHYLGRPATPPIALSLEAAWEIVSDNERLAEEIEKLAPVERRLLESIESVGGEVETQELLDLEREPMRLRGASGVTASRRGAGFALERRAFLIPIHPNRHVIPTEVARIVGAERNVQRQERRAEIRSYVIVEDHAPRRARFASDPAMLAVALAFAARDVGAEIRPGVGTPKSLLVRQAQRFGRELDGVALLSAVSRAIGLWDVSAASLASPPGSLTLHELSSLLFQAWRRGGAWDEARSEREVYRIAADSRDPSPLGSLRHMVLEALSDLGEGRWVPWQALHGYLSADSRIPGIERLLRRWAERSSIDAPDPVEVARRIALESLPVLGILDLGSLDIGGDASGFSLRLTGRGRALLADQTPPPDPTCSEFVDGHTLRVANSARVGSVLSLSSFAEIGRVGSDLELIVSPQGISRALSAGIEPEVIRGRIEAVAPLSDSLARVLAQASVVIGRATLAAASGFLWIDDPEIRELLRTRRPASELFVDPSPPAGLIVAPDVDTDRLVRRCRALGVELEADGAALRVRTPSVPPLADTARTSGARPVSVTRARSSKTPAPRKP